MRKTILALTLTSFLLISVTRDVSARSGCCSHHGGVCGCGCCDGSALSNTCAPYYPSCSRPVYYAPTPTKSPIVYTPRPSTPIPTQVPTSSPTLNPTLIPEVKSVSTQTQTETTPNTTSGFSNSTLLVISGGGLTWLVLKILRKI